MRLVAALDAPAVEVTRIRSNEVVVRRPGGGLLEERPGSLSFLGEPSEMALLIEVARHAVWLRDGEGGVRKLSTPENQQRLWAEPHAETGSFDQRIMHMGCAALAYTLGFTEIEGYAFQDIVFSDAQTPRSKEDCYALLEMMVWEIQAGRDPRTVYEAFKTPDLAA